MPRTSISIKRSRPDQCDLRRHREHGLARLDFLQALGLDVGRQAITRRDAGAFALNMLTDAESEPSVDTVRMGRGGRGRLDGADDEQFDGLLDSVAVDPAATEQEALRGEKLLELLDEAGHYRGLIVIASHLGDIESRTDSQAEHVRDLLADIGVSCWRCKGWGPNGGALPVGTSPRPTSAPPASPSPPP